MTTFDVSTPAAFQAALAQAHAGDLILLRPGKYSGLSIENVNISSGRPVTISSQNRWNRAVLRQFQITNSSRLSFSHLDFSAAGATDQYYVWRVTGSNNISFDSVTVTGESNLTPADNPAAFLFSNCSYMSVTNSTFRRFLDGILEAKTNHINISDNLFVQMGGDGVDSVQVAYVTINNNSFTDFETGSQHPDAIQFWTEGTTVASHDITISGNVYTRGALPASSNSQGIFLNDEVGTLPYSNVVITNNTILGGAYNGIMLVHGANATISNNIVRGYSDMESWIRVSNSTTTALSNNAAQKYILSQNTVSVTQTNDATVGPMVALRPALSNNGSPAAYAAGGPTAVASQLSLVDIGSPIIVSARVAITGGFLAGDALNFANRKGIDGSYNTSTGVLTLTGMGTVANYRAALDSITFSSSVSDPAHGGADRARTISFSVSDPLQSSNTLAATLHVPASSSSPPTHLRASPPAVRRPAA